MVNERTPILPQNPFKPFNGDRLKWFNPVRCCLCTILIGAIIAILLTSIFYTVTGPIPNPNLVNESLSFLNLTWPLQDRKSRNESDTLDDSDKDVFAIMDFDKMSLSNSSEAPALDVPSLRHRISMSTSERARELSQVGLLFEMMTKELRNRSEHFKRGKWRHNDTEVEIQKTCRRGRVTVCAPSPYRSPDGSCNNLGQPTTWGVALTPFRRVLPPDYADGISSPRQSARGGNLPPARQVSLTVHRASYAKDLDFTVMLAVWGQFIDHDMTSTALSQGSNGSPITCCYAERHPECFPVLLRDDDPFYKQYNVTCMDFVRSAPAPTCRFGSREQLNQASSFIDGSAIYGNTAELMRNLRSFNGGELKMLIGPSGEELLPVSTNVNDGCNREEELRRGRYCFLTGDPRSNENLHLTSMHLLFARQHNALARGLSALNPGWSDELLFQESRRILVAQLQHITYGEFLPSVLPASLMAVLNLTIRSEGYWDGYNASVEPNIANSFASCVFRFGHSLLPGLLRLISNDSVSEEYVELHKMLFNPFGLYDKEFLEGTLRGALNTSADRSDVYFSREVTGKLFQDSDGKKRGPCGLDLVSLNIQRGRDHGLPGYPAWRDHCGQTRVRSFDDLRGVFDAESLEKIKSLYKSVVDIDLFTGGLAEIPIKGSLLGPTFTCLLADQFLRLKMGDRFWYETGEKSVAFSPDQLREIRKTSLARIICNNSHIEEAQPLVMRRVGANNQRIPCRDLPTPSLDPWKKVN